MHEGPHAYDLDLLCTTDELLVVLAQETPFHPATGELMLRYYEPMNKLIARKVKDNWLAVDVQDAQQNGVFAILEAIASYDTLEASKPHGCSFRSYVRMVVLARFRDFVKHVRRTKRRDRCLEEARSGAIGGKGGGCAGLMSDPAEAMIHQEEMTRLHQALDRLDPPMRRLWQELISGKKLTQIAREQGISNDQMKRQRQRLLARLIAEVGEARDERSFRPSRGRGRAAFSNAS
jgi:RNA polymerase sigma factor (sigma-70 family)